MRHKADTVIAAPDQAACHPNPSPVAEKRADEDLDNDSPPSQTTSQEELLCTLCGMRS
jgi:hypothetical protein